MIVCPKGCHTLMPLDNKCRIGFCGGQKTESESLKMTRSSLSHSKLPECGDHRCCRSRHCWRSPLPQASALIQRDFGCVLGVQQTKQLPHVAKVDLIRRASQPGKQFNLVIDEEPLDNACHVWSRIILSKYGSWLTWHGLEPSAIEDPMSRVRFHVKSVEAQTSSRWCGVVGEGTASSGVVLFT
ncbi:hypothetical protein TNCV_4951701 [Trichonephila clavipes]|nr:hypothetical protein TNCV_4951701 [Trichonephila clavipes]